MKESACLSSIDSVLGWWQMLSGVSIMQQDKVARWPRCSKWWYHLPATEVDHSREMHLPTIGYSDLSRWFQCSRDWSPLRILITWCATMMVHALATGASVCLTPWRNHWTEFETSVSPQRNRRTNLTAAPLMVVIHLMVYPSSWWGLNNSSACDFLSFKFIECRCFLLFVLICIVSKANGTKKIDTWLFSFLFLI